ncbi:putative cysteine protease atg4 [Cladobotryum mycophilum]|uniref:Cysteine protease n=1 Tax=Cladobotryum mycophilum TaxID=491253 RepID=A0ABR0SUK4_9HYPO
MESAIANVDLGRYRRIVQMFWDPEPSNDANSDQPVWCLGCSYKLSDGKEPTAGAICHDATQDALQTTLNVNNILLEQDHMKTIQAPLTNAPETPPESAPNSLTSSLACDDLSQGGWPSGFLDDFTSKFWMTYRSDFDLIAKSSDPRAISALSLSMRIKSQLADPSGFSSDSGWGCMIRSGQSLLANTIGILRLGRDWRRGRLRQEERQIIGMFADDPRAPYSIHNFVRHGSVACGKYPGEWFGPSATARCIQDLTNSQEMPLRVYSTGDGQDVYEDSFMKIAKPDGLDFHPTLILVGTRLGIDKITPVYWEALIASLQMPQSVGIAGGRPASSHYFIGAQGKFLFYLDPHHTRKGIQYRPDPADYTDAEIDSCHTSRLRRLHIREMDPSMLIGFLIRSEDDWVEWRRCVRHVQGKAVIHVADHDPMLHGAGEDAGSVIDRVEPLSDEDSDTSLAT